MTVPKENIWQELRSDCLSTIPPDSRVIYSKPVSLSVWQKQGYYSVTNISQRRYTLLTASADMGGALLGDVEYLLDSAAEHQVSLWRHINTSEWLSPAWLAVTFYYWAFFLVLALTRMLGKSAWFLDKEASRMFLKLFSSKAGSPGSGCFRFSCGPQVSITEREILLDKTGSRIHDEIWKLWFSLCQDKLQRLGTGSSNSLEERLFACMVRTGQNLGNEWPSAFRNVVNYRPGFAYSAVRKVRVLESFRHLCSRPIDDTASLIGQFESHVVAVHHPVAIIATPQRVCDLLVDVTFSLHALASELHAELIDRHALDRRWKDNRLRFLKENKVLTNKKCWPC